MFGVRSFVHRPSFHRPHLESLESRFQPGSVLPGMGALHAGATAPSDPLAPADGWADTTATHRPIADDDLLPAQSLESFSVVPESVSVPIVPAASAPPDTNAPATVPSSDEFDNAGASLAGMGFGATMPRAGSSRNAPALSEGALAASSGGLVRGGSSAAFAKIGSVIRPTVMPPATTLTPQEAPDQGAALGQEPAPLRGAANLTTPAQGQLPQPSSLMPLVFEANQGQADRHFQFAAHGQGYDLALSATDARLNLGQPSPAGTSPGAAPAAAGVTVDMQLLGADPAAAAAGQDELPGKVNYIIGSDRSRWHTNIPTYGRVEYRDVYPGVNLVYYTPQQQLEYDFDIAPGANPNVIRLAFSGADQLSVDAQGNLLVQAGGSAVREQKPFAYQESHGVRQEIPSRFVVQGQQVSFQVGSYDASQPLVIDPKVLVLYEQVGSRGASGANDVKVDALGNIYLTGYFQNAGAGPTYAFVEKLNRGGGLVYFMEVDPFAGNPGDFVDGRGLAIDAFGDAFVSGSASANGVVQKGFEFAMDPTGGVLYAYTTGLPGSLGGVWADAGGNAYYTGGLIDPNTGAYDMYADKVAANGAVVYESYIVSAAGGNAFGLGIAADGAGNANISGQIFNGLINVGYVVQLNAVGNPVWQYAYNIPSQNGGITVDGVGNIYVAGQRLGGPTGQHGLLLLKLTPQGGRIYNWIKPVGVTFSPYFPRIAVDAVGDAYVSEGLLHSRRGRFAWVGKFSPAGNVRLGHWVIFNGAGSDAATGVALDNRPVPNIYVSGITNRGIFGGTSDGFLAEFQQSP